MAKDGTNRGGRRVRAGDKPKPLAEKIAAGEDADIIEFTPTALEGADLDDAADLVGEDMPSPSEYISARQKDGKPLGADEIYKETWIWLKNRGCEKLVNKRLLESYSLAFARFIQCEEALSTYGLLGKHPTTGGVVASPFASLSQSYQKQANVLWYEIFDIVKQNCTTKFDGSPQDETVLGQMYAIFPELCRMEKRLAELQAALEAGGTDEALAQWTREFYVPEQSLHRRRRAVLQVALPESAFQARLRGGIPPSAGIVPERRTADPIGTGAAFVQRTGHSSPRRADGFP